HFLDEDAAVSRAEQVHHAPGQDRLGKPVCRLLHGGLLPFDRSKEFAAVMEIVGTRAHRASSLTGKPRMENHEWTRIRHRDAVSRRSAPVPEGHLITAQRFNAGRLSMMQVP